jgi:hypothetical protein
MKVIYIAGKFRGPTAWAIEQNIRKAEIAALGIAELGASPLCPHANTRFFHGTLTDQFWLDATMALLRKCDGLFAIANWSDSTGARDEIAEANILRMPVFLEDIDGWKNLATWLKMDR